MVAFEVPDMSCAHCVGVITRAVLGVAPGAAVQVDLAAHRVEVDAGEAPPEVLREAIAEAGYTPRAV